MANWSGLMLTRKGELLHAKVEINLCNLHLTKIKLGSGVLEDGQQLETLTDLIRPQQTVGIGSVTDNKDGTVTIEGIITNADLETGYTVTEMGLFATDPDEGEILYAITRDAHPDYLPAKGGATIVAQEFNLSIGITNAANVTATIHMGSLATIEHIQKIIKMLKEHNAAHDAHENRFAAVMAALGGYLPLAGGVMSGNIILDPQNAYRAGGMTHYRPDGYLEFMGAPDWWKGATLQLYGKDYPRDGFANCFRLSTGNGGSVLLGTPNDGLFWDGIITLGAKNTNRINQIRVAYDDGYFEILGAQSFEDGPSIQMYGKKYTKQPHLTGVMRIGCHNHSLYLCPDGRMMWDNINIGAGGVVAQMLGETGYIKLAGGLIIQWGHNANGEVIFPVAFTSRFSVTANSDYQGNNNITCCPYDRDTGQIADNTTSVFDPRRIYIKQYGGNQGDYVFWQAIGF